jgi:hypothetical protein
MNAKHQFKYTYNDTDLEEFSPVDVTFEMPGDITLTQMLWNFECYLKACGFYFDGKLDFVKEGHESFEEESEECCMADFANDCGFTTNTSPLEASDTKNGCMPGWDDFLGAYNEKSTEDKKLKEWNEGIAKLDNELREQRDIEVAKNKWVHGVCNPKTKQ